MQPEHRRADVRPVRARREIIEHRPHRRRQAPKTSQCDVIVRRPERAPERSRFGTDLVRWIGLGPAVVSAELLLEERAVARIADHGRGGERESLARPRVRIPGRRRACPDLRSRDHAREIRVDVVIRPERSDIGGARQGLVPAGCGQQHSPANGESKGPDRHSARIRMRKQSREGRVDDRRRARFEGPFANERELRQHHEIPRSRERLGESGRLRIVVPERRRPVHHHQTGMPVAPAGTPPGHTHLDSTEGFPRSDHHRERRDVLRKVAIPKRARVDVGDQNRSRADRSKERAPEDRDRDDQNNDQKLPPHSRRLYLGRGGEAPVPDAVFHLLPERDDLARVEDR